MKQDLDTGTGKLRAWIDDGVAFLELHQPDKLNALSVEMLAGMPPVLERCSSDDAVRVVVLRGSGDKAFASGADISEFEKHRSSTDARAHFDATWGAANRSFQQFEKPVIAVICGYCFGGGLAMSLNADFRYASDDARFAIPAARLGLGYRYAGVRALTGLVGPSVASEILFSARHLSAEEALRYGLVNRVLPAAELDSATSELLGRIRDNAPLTIRAAKAAIRATQRDPKRRDLDRVEALVRACFESDDYKEGRRAFMEKRRPDFKGR